MIDVLFLHLSLVTSALVAGGLALVSLGIVRAGRTLDARSWPELHRALDTTIGPYMSRVLALAILAVTGLAISASGSRVHFAVAAALFAGVLAISVSVNVPLNRAVAHWTVPPPTWERTRARWNTFQHLRATLALVGFAVVVVGSGAS